MNNEKKVSDFSTEYISVQRTGGKYTMTNNFKLDEPCVYSWYIYDYDDTKETIARFNNRESNTLIYEAENLNLMIKIKAFVCDKDGNKAAVWAAESLDDETPPESMKMSDLSKDEIKELVEWEYFSRSEREANGLIKGEYKGYRFPLPIDWSLPEIDSRTMYGRFYSYRAFMSVFQAAFNLSNYPDNPYLDFLFDITRAFLDTFKEFPKKHDDRAWNDDHVARRTIIWCNMYLLWHDRMDAELKSGIEFGLWHNARILCQDWFYTKKHNHGMFQDQALTMYAIMFRHTDPKSEYYLELAQKRVSEYFAYVISEDGVAKEHSPQYHSKIACPIGWFEKNYRAFTTFEQFNDFLADKMNKMLNYAVHITKPDGNMAEIGDSGRAFYTNRYWSDNPYYKYMNSKGSEGEPPQETSAFFLMGGYAVMRSSWQPFDGASWALLSAATHSLTHKHNDDLNFLVYHRGELITEAGQRNYDYKDVMTNYTYSSYAHNVLFIDGEAWPLGRANGATPLLTANDYKTKITEYGDDNGIAWASAESYRWGKIKQTRTLIYDRNTQTITVRDLLEANQTAKARLIYHIADGVEVEALDNGWICSRDGDIVAVITASGELTLKLSILRGEGEPPFRTWIFKGLEPSEGTLLVLDFDCRAGINEAELEIKLFAADEKLTKEEIESLQNETVSLKADARRNNKLYELILIKISVDKYGADLAEQIISGENLYVFDGLAEENIPFDIENIDWEMKVTKSPKSYSLYLQGLNPILYLVCAYQQTKDIKYLKFAEKFIRSWLSKYKYNAPAFLIRLRRNAGKAVKRESMAWNDHAVAIRAENILAYMLTILKDNLNIDIAYLQPVIKRHAEWLNDDKNYTFNHNHGIFQDIALYIIGLFLSDGKYCAKATERIKGQLKYSYPFKTHIENSMIYFLIMEQLVISIKKIFDDAEIQRLCEKAIKNTAEFLVYACRPDLTLPSYGDTAGTQYLRKITAASPEFEYAKGNNIVKLFKEDGFAFLRSTFDREKLAQSAWLMFRSGFNSLTHKHKDELSITWWAKGQDILIDPGMYNYVYKDPVREYMNGVSAHSAISVNNRDYYLLSHKLEALRNRAGMLDNTIESGKHRFKAYNNLYDGVKINRSVICFDENTLILIDDIVSGNNNYYTQIFHLSEKIEVQASEVDEVTAKVSDEWNLSIRQLTAVDSVKIIRGQNAGSGEISVRSIGLNKVIPTTSILFRASGTSCKFVTVLQLFRDRNDLYKIEIKEDYLYCAGENFSLKSRNRDDFLQGTH